MGSWWRSEDMTYISMVVPEEVAAPVIKELGTLGCIQFTDLSPHLTPFQRRYVAYVKRCDEMERKIRYISTECNSLDVHVEYGPTVEEFLKKPSEVSFDTIEDKLNKYEGELTELTKYGKKLSDEYSAKVSEVCLYTMISFLRISFSTDRIPTFSLQDTRLHFETGKDRRYHERILCR